MNLLLLLSALLSALTGVGGEVRTPGLVQRVAERSIAVREAQTPRHVTIMRPIAAFPLLAAVATSAICVVAPVIASAPLWTSRRRE